MGDINNTWRIYTCDCGKDFIPTPNYVYKLIKGRESNKYYCSYTCWRKAGGGTYKNKYIKREKD